MRIPSFHPRQLGRCALAVALFLPFLLPGASKTPQRKIELGHIMGAANVFTSPVPPAFTSSAPPDTAEVGVPYSHTFTASGNPPPTFDVTAGSLPPGLVLDGTTDLLSSASSVLSGTPTMTGTYTFTVTASNGVPPDAMQDVTIEVQAGEDSFFVYLPLVSKPEKPPIPVEVVITAYDVYGDYPTYYYVYGYVRSLTDGPLYSVVLEIDVTWYPYLGLPYDAKETIWPALTATLPDQVNPFSYELILGKASASLGEVRAVDASSIAPDGRVYQPLTVVGWEHMDGTLSGTIRNDSGQPLQDARIFVAELTKCRWREAEMAVTTLQPGQETAFSLDLSKYCLGDNLVIVGQGTVQP